MENKETEILVRKTIEGDTSAFEKLYEETNQRVYFICLNFLRSEQDSKDAMQDTYLTAFKNIRQLSEPQKFRSWVERIAVNRCKDILKKNQPIPVDDDILKETLLTEDEFTIPEKYIIDKEKRRILMDIMRTKLTDLQYQTIILYYFNNLSVTEIAEIMECSEGSVKNRLSKARTAIKKAIEEYQKDKDDKLFVFAGVPFLAKVFDEESKTLTAPALNTAMLTGSAAAGTTVSTSAGTALKTGGIIMSKKILIGILAGIAVVGGITAAIIVAVYLGSNHTSEKNTLRADSSAVSEYVNSDSTENSDSSSTTLSFQMTPHYNFQDKQGEVMQNGGCTDAQYDYAVLKDNTVWNFDSPSNKYTQVATLDDGSDEIVSKTVYTIGEGGSHVVTFNTLDGRTKVYDKEGHSAVIPTTDFSMLKSNTSKGIYNTYQITDGKLTVTVYDAGGNIIADKQDVTLYSSELGYITADDMKGIYIYRNSYAVLKNSGTMFFFTQLPLFTGETQDKYELGVSAYFDIIHFVNEPLSTNDSLEIFYTAMHDDQLIHYTKTVFGHRNDHSGTCCLPEGYTASDVEMISSYSDIYVFMKDKTVFYAPEITESPSWVAVDVISDMNKKGELKSFRNIGMTKNVLKTDGTFYSLWVKKGE